MDRQLIQLNIYPIKSCQGISPASASAEPRGFALDRRWMLVEADGSFITQRNTPLLGRIQVNVDNESLMIKYPDMPALTLRKLQHGFERIATQVWKDPVDGLHVSSEADAWFSKLLGRAVRLLHMDDSVRRPRVKEWRSQDIAFEVSFADGYPYLLTNQASLEDLNSRLEQPIGMDRFRSNLVVKGSEPFEEDQWKRIQIGAVEFLVVKPCARCQITTIDPQSGISSKEPLKTLASYRKQGGQVMFGMNLIAVKQATLRIGDPVTILE